MYALHRTSCKQSGTSLIEVMVTLIILLVGLLGLAGLQVQTQRSEMESYQRVQALVLMEDMAGRIAANRFNAASYVTNTLTPAYLGASDVQPGVSACAALANIPARDQCEWSNALKGASEQQSGVGATGSMAGGRGCVTYDAASSAVMVSVAWQGLGDTVAPPASLSCGQNQYGSETKRRVVSKPVKFGCLSC